MNQAIEHLTAGRGDQVTVPRRAMTLSELQRAIARSRGDVFTVNRDTYSNLLSRVPVAERSEWEYIPWFTSRGVVRIKRVKET